ncbi:MAG: ABC transporter ATP-binding protein [Thaumarchaeota archaeon]|nr:ABC transporter ATP-binding protein [Nitrososphaerota archaeon]
MRLAIEHVSKRFGNLVAVNDCSITLEKDGIYGLIGPNGSGKTTLFNVVTGFLRPDEGNVTFNDTSIARKNPISISKQGIGRTFQLPRLFTNLTVEENLEVAKSKEIGPQKTKELLEIFNLTQVRSTRASILSYGQKKQLELARVLAMNPQFLMLDEPTSGLEPSLVNVMVDQIKYARELGKSVFIIEHNMNVIMNLAEKIFVLHNGRKIAEGIPGDIRADSLVIDAYLGEEEMREEAGKKS